MNYLSTYESFLKKPTEEDNVALELFQKIQDTFDITKLEQKGSRHSSYSYNNHIINVGYASDCFMGDFEIDGDEHNVSYSICKKFVKFFKDKWNNKERDRKLNNLRGVVNAEREPEAKL